MDLLSTHIYYYLLIITLAVILSVAAIPSIIITAAKYKLYDNADDYRKAHQWQISRLGGVAIFCSFSITTLLFAAMADYKQANYLLTSCIILFALGLKDDLYGVNPRTKFALQLLVAIILVVLGNFRLSSLYGVFFIWETNLLWGSLFSIAVIIFVNNAFNLIDGIDGLAGCLGLISTFTFGVFFAVADAFAYAFIAFAMFGSIIGFLLFNFSPAKIFMGDTGALLIGLVSVVLAIKFIELNKLAVKPEPHFYSAPAIAVAVMLVPIFDSLRIFFIRILYKSSPFVGDRNHIHHRLQYLGFTANQIVLSLCVFNLLMIVLVVSLQHLGNFALIFILLFICILMNAVVTYAIGKKHNSKYKWYDVFFKAPFKFQED